MRIVLGLIGIALGVLVTLKAEWFLQNIGHMPSMEKYLGVYGGTRLFYQILGVVIIAASTLYMTGALGALVTWLFLKLFKPGAEN